jgi:hypothetical protein
MRTTSIYRTLSASSSKNRPIAVNPPCRAASCPQLAARKTPAHGGQDGYSETVVIPPVSLQCNVIPLRRSRGQLNSPWLGVSAIEIDDELLHVVRVVRGGIELTHQNDRLVQGGAGNDVAAVVLRN